MQRDFDLMDKSLKDFALNRKSFEEQSATIAELQKQLKQMSKIWPNDVGVHRGQSKHHRPSKSENQ